MKNVKPPVQPPLAKISPTQLKALAQDIAWSLDEKVAAAKKALPYTKAYRAAKSKYLASQLCKDLATINKLFKKHGFKSTSNYEKENRLEEEMKKQFPVLKYRRATSEQVYNDLVVLTIHSNNLEDIKAQVTAKYVAKFS